MTATTQKPTFTPGPWEAEMFMSPPYAQAGSYIYGANEAHVAIVQTHLEATPADARLIAKAPELYADMKEQIACLSNAVHVLAYNVDCSGPGWGATTGIDDVITDLNKRIESACALLADIEGA